MDNPENTETQLTAMLEYWAERRKENATSEELQNALKILNKMISPNEGEVDRRDATLTNDVPTLTVNL